MNIGRENYESKLWKNLSNVSQTYGNKKITLPYSMGILYGASIGYIYFSNIGRPSDEKMAIKLSFKKFPGNLTTDGRIYLTLYYGVRKISARCPTYDYPYALVYGYLSHGATATSDNVNYELDKWKMNDIYVWYDKGDIRFVVECDGRVLLNVRYVDPPNYLYNLRLDVLEGEQAFDNLIITPISKNRIEKYESMVVTDI